MSSMQISGPTRCVTTGRVGGRSVIASDRTVETTTVAIAPGAGFTRVFGTEALRLPNSGAESKIESYFPPAGGMAVYTLELPLDAPAPVVSDEKLSAFVDEASRKLPGLLDVMEPDGSTFHTTPTIDVLIVLSGRVVLEVDDGVTSEIGPGDVVVQNGTRHRWRNPFDMPAVLHAVSLGVEPSDQPRTAND